MDSSNLPALLEQLDDNADDLELSLGPLFKTALSETAAKLPLLDKAKLYVLVTYSLESVIFSYLRLNGINAKEHAVFRELSRVRNYFEKIKHVETSGAKRENLTLDRQAAARFVKHALAGNEKYDLDRAEKIANEKAKAHIKFEQLSNKRKADDIEGLAQDSDDISAGGPEPILQKPEAEASSVKSKKRNKKNPKPVPQTSREDSSAVENQDSVPETVQIKSERTARPKSNRAPRSHSAAFEALLKGPLPKIESDDKKAKKKGKKETKRTRE